MLRTQIYQALATKLQGLTSAPYALTIPVITLGLVLAEDQPRQPAIYVVPLREASEYQRGRPLKWTVDAELYVYTKPTDSSDPASAMIVLLPILDGIDSIFAPQNQNAPPNAVVNNLGLPNLVSSAHIKSIEIFGGYLGGQTIARMTIQIISAG